MPIERRRIGRSYALTDEWAGPTAREILAGELLRRNLQVAEPLWSSDELYVIEQTAAPSALVPIRVKVRAVQATPGVSVVPLTCVTKADLDEPLCVGAYAPRTNRIWFFVGRDQIEQAYEAQRSTYRDLSPFSDLARDATVPLYLDVSTTEPRGWGAGALLDRSTPRNVKDETRELVPFSVGNFRGHSTRPFGDDDDVPASPRC